MPRLLVSVRNADEARLLRDTACAIVDVKEPANGALGSADVAVQQAVCEVVDFCSLSFALGEVTEWSERIALPSSQYLKMGLAGLGGRPDWPVAWQAARAAADGACPTPPSWVAVAYADHEAANSPEPHEVLDAASTSGCSVLLVDTYVKAAGRNVFSAMSVSQLTSLREAANHAGLEFALAGQLRTSDRVAIAEIAADIVGIRGAACSAGDRTGQLCADAVNAFAAAIGAGENVVRQRSL